MRRVHIRTFTLLLGGLLAVPSAAAAQACVGSAAGVPVGAGIGYSFQAGPNMTVIPHAFPHLLWMRTSFDMEGASESVSDSTTEFGAVVGVTFQLQRFFLNGGVTKTTVEDSKAVFSLGAGVLF